MRLVYITIPLLFCAAAFAQTNEPSPEKKETPVHEKKVLVKDGKIYWNKSLPVYLFVSTKPDGSDMMRLESTSTKEYANPMYFDTEGINYIRHKWAIDPETGKPVSPELEVQFEVYNDGMPPITTADIEGKNRYNNGSTIFYGEKVTVTLSAEDGLSGVDQIYQVVNGAQFVAYKQPIELTQGGTYTVQYYAADQVGNVEKVQEKKFVLDLNPPTSNHVVEGTRQGDVLSPKATIRLDRNDAESGLKRTFYQFDGEPEKIYYGPINLNALADGNHTLTYYAEDKVGNVETKKTYDFYLDKTPPRIVSIVQGDRFNNRGRNYISGRSKLKLVANDNKSGVDKVYYQINGGEFQEYTDPFPIQRSQGNMIVSFYATDMVGNRGGASTDRNLGNMYLDLTAPNVSYSVVGPKLFTRDTMFISGESKIRLTASDSESGIQKMTYVLDGAAQQDYADPFPVTGVNGVHKFTYSAIDQVYNQMTKDDFVVLDTKGPEVYFHPSMQRIATQRYEKQNMEVDVYTSETQFYLAATDKLVGTDKIYYKIDKTLERLYTTPVVISKKGKRKLTVWAVDELGNKSEESVFEFVIQ